MRKYLTSHQVKIYECDRLKKLRLLSLFNLLQEIAEMHATEMGVGYNYCLDHGIAWVCTSYHLKINRLPSWQENIKLLTWPSDRTVVCGIREFEALDKDGVPLFCASSQWALINSLTLKPVSTKKFLPLYEPVNERRIDTNFPLVGSPDRIDFERRFNVRYDDIDGNDHVNNAVYPLWASEGVPTDFRQTKDIAEVKISYKKPAVLKDEICVLTQIDGNSTIHRITSTDQTKDYAGVQIWWGELR